MTTQIILEITANDPNTRDQELDSAVQIASRQAAIRGEGVLVTQKSYFHYTIATSPEVPFGLTRELRAWS